MRRLGLFALLGLLVLATSTASAASLKVDVGVLQAWTVNVDLLDCDAHPDAPHCAEEIHVAVTFEIHHYAGNSRRPDHTDVLGPYLIPAGRLYNVEWSGHERACSTEPLHPNGTNGPFETDDTDLVHTLCVQKGQAGVLTVTLDDGTVFEPSGDGPLGLSSTSVTLCDGFEDASFCGGPSDH